MQDLDERKITSLQTALNGMQPEQIRTLSELSEVRSLRPGDLLDETAHAYVILDGEVDVFRYLGGRTRRLTTHRAGQWLNEAVLTGVNGNDDAFVANAPTRMMEVKQSSIDALNEKTRLVFYQCLNRVLAQQAQACVAREKLYAEQNVALKEQILTEGLKTRKDYGQVEMIQRIVEKVPRLPVFASSLAFKLLEDRISASEVARLVKEDPSLLALVLKTINSAYYSFQEKIVDINHAVVILGFNELYQLIVGEGIRRTLPNVSTFQKLYIHCSAISHLAFVVSQVAQIERPTHMATAGLLHAVGETVMYFLHKQNAKLSIFLDFINSDQLGALLLKHWNLPESIHATIAHKTYPDFAPPEKVPDAVREKVAILHLAHLCLMQLKGAKPKDPPSMYFNDYCHVLHWDQLDWHTITFKKVLPVLAKHSDTLPSYLRKLINDQNRAMPDI